MAEGENVQSGRSEEDGGGGKEERSKESVKLFVGQVPKNMTETQLLAFFKEAALVDEVKIIKDKFTMASRGCCFVLCPSREEADKVVDAFHNQRALPGASTLLQVKYAEGELERLEHKLFIGMLPKNVSDSELSALFSKYGVVKELQILRGSQQTSKGCAFLKYETKEQALAALDAINGKHRMEDVISDFTKGVIHQHSTMKSVNSDRERVSERILAIVEQIEGEIHGVEGSTVPLIVKWADTEKERQARRAAKAHLQASNTQNTFIAQQSSLFGALPMGYIHPSYNGYSYQPPGKYGMMQHPMSPLQSQPGYANIVPSVSQANTVSVTSPVSVSTSHYAGSHYHPLPYPVTYPGIMNPQHLGQLTPLTNGSAVHSSLSGSTGSQTEGPPGANLFIYHIPQEFGDHDLSEAFQPYGRVLSAKVFVDKATGISKCFGFVSYDSPAAAQTAISMMNGFQLEGKKLKVQLKRDNKQIKPH